MSERDPMLEPPVLLRAAADDELDQSQHDALEAHLAQHPRDVDRIEFERRLRGACGRVMADVPVPEGLASRVRAALDADALSERLEAKADETSRAGFWNRGRAAGLFAAAAVIVLAFGLFQWGPSGSSGLDMAGLGLQIANFTAREHVHCDLDPEHVISKMSADEPHEIPPLAQRILGLSLDEALFSPDIEMLGAGRCHVPGGGPSIHIRLRDLSAPEAVFSLYVQRDTGSLGLDESTTYVCTPGEAAPIQSPVLFWRHGGLIYYLVCPAENARNHVRDVMKFPDLTLELR
jgi:anti-sigma factor RsiW